MARKKRDDKIDDIIFSSVFIWQSEAITVNSQDSLTIFNASGRPHLRKAVKYTLPCSKRKVY